MPTVSFHVPAAVAKRIQASSKRKGVPVSKYLRTAAENEMARDEVNFGDWAKKYAGIVRSGRKDLSEREGFDA